MFDTNGNYTDLACLKRLGGGNIIDWKSRCNEKDNEDFIMNLTLVERISAFTALREEEIGKSNSFITTKEHKAAVKRFLANNKITLLDCDVEHAMVKLKIISNYI